MAIVSGMVALTRPDLAALPPRPKLQVLCKGAERRCANRLVYRTMATTAKLLLGPMVCQASPSMPEADRATIRDPGVADAVGPPPAQGVREEGARAIVNDLGVVAQQADKPPEVRSE